MSVLPAHLSTQESSVTSNYTFMCTPLPNTEPVTLPHTDDFLAHLLIGSWTAEQFSDMERSIRQWARQSAGFEINHNSKPIEHHFTCPEAKQNKVGSSNPPIQPAGDRHGT